MQQLVLASQSPRRVQLLSEAGFEFRINPVKVSEIIDENLNIDEAIKALSQRKAQGAIEEHKLLKEKNILVLSADTIVYLQGKVYGKPKNLDQARAFLSELSGKKHSVKTAICLWDLDQQKVLTAIDTTLVEFHQLSSQQIEEYVATGEPMDKAGAYAIQGEGRKLVLGIFGSWSNVVGLPMELLERMLKENGWSPRRK